MSLAARDRLVAVALTWWVEAALLAVTVGLFAVAHDTPPTPALSSLDNTTTGERTVALVRDGPLAVWTAAGDPHLRYVPVAIFALARYGAVTPAEATLIAGWYAYFVEAAAVPVLTGTLAAVAGGRRAGRAALAVVSVAHGWHVVDQVVLTSPASVTSAPTGSLTTLFSLLHGYVAGPWYQLGYTALLGTTWLTHRRTGWSLLTAGLVGALAGLGVLSLLAWETYLYVLFRHYADHLSLYFAFALPWALGTAVATVRATQTGARRWSLAAGLCLGTVGSTQLAQGTVLAVGVAAALLAARKPRALLSTALSAVVVWLPTAYALSTSWSWVAGESERVLDLSGLYVPVLVVFGLWLAAFAVFAASAPSTDGPDARGVLATLVFGVAGACAVFYQMSEFWGLGAYAVLFPLVSAAVGTVFADAVTTSSAGVSSLDEPSR